MRDIYVNESTPVISVSITGGTTLNAVWKRRKDTWYVVKAGSEKSVIDVLTPGKFHEAIQNGKYSLMW
jgi:hypothetical protein